MKTNNKTLLLLLLFFTLKLAAQNDNSLLWQISGNGLKSNSYLFGSIHISDKRIFDFPDSVIAKLKECEVTAFELNLDSITGQVLNEAIKKAQKKRVQDLLSNKEIEALKKSFKKKNISTENLEKETPLTLYSRYQKQLYKNDMSTFLDAYLFGLSKKYGKTPFGIETYNEQINAFNSVKDDDQRKFLNSMIDSASAGSSPMDSLIDYYLQQNINKIYQLTENAKLGDFESIVVTKRNYVMDKRIDSLIQKQSTFICVGTGHLPGNEGLISLLKKRGYTVSPMYSPKTKYYKKILPDESIDTWKFIVDEPGGYRIKMPSEASPLNIYGIEMKGCMDYGSGYFYMSYGMPSKGGKESSQKAADAIIKRFEDMGEVSSKKSISFSNMKGYEIDVKIKQANNMIRVLSDTGSTYLLMVSVQNKKLEKDVIKKFFSSLVPIERKKQDFIVFSDDTGAFRINVPSSFKLTESSYEKTAYKTFSGYDYANGSVISVTYIDYKPGLFFPDLNLLYETSFDAIKKALASEPSIAVDTLFKGYKCRDYKITAKDNSTIYIRYMMRGCRLYMISVTYKEESHEADALKHLSSFDFLPLRKSKLQMYTSSAKDFKLLMPGITTTVIDSSDSNSENRKFEYEARDKFSNNWIKIYTHRFTDYQYLKNDSEAIAFFKEYLVSEKSILRDSSITIKGNRITGNFVVNSAKNPNISKRVKAVANGRTFYLILTLEDSIQHPDSLNKAIFNSFEILTEDKSFNVMLPKKDRLLTDLCSSDSSQHKKALDVFANYSFAKTDQKQLEEMLSKKFIDDTRQDSDPFMTRSLIYKHIYELMDTTEEIAFIKKQYNNMPDTGRIRIEALAELATIENTESISAWKELIISKPPVSDFDDLGYCTGRMAIDSLPLLASLYPELNPFINNNQLKEIYYSLTANALRNKIIELPVFSSNKETMITEAVSEYQLMNTVPPEGEQFYYSPTFNDVMQLLDALPAMEAVTQLNKRIIADTITDDKVGAYLYLAKNNIQINPALLKGYLKKASNRNLLYEKLEEIKRLDVYPSEMKKQKLLAEGDISFAANFDEAPGKLDFIEERKIERNGKTVRFFIYKINYGEADSYLGASGPYPTSDATLVSRGSGTSINLDPIGTKNINQQITEFLDLIQ